MNWKKQNSQLFYYQFSCLLKTLENVLTRKQERLSGLFPFPIGSKCGISKQVNAATKQWIIIWLMKQQVNKSAWELV